MVMKPKVSIVEGQPPSFPVRSQPVKGREAVWSKWPIQAGRMTLPHGGWSLHGKNRVLALCEACDLPQPARSCAFGQAGCVCGSRVGPGPDSKTIRSRLTLFGSCGLSPSTRANAFQLGQTLARCKSGIISIKHSTPMQRAQ